MADLKLAPATNRKPADELFEVREKIRVLKDREEILRARFLAGDADPVGDDYEVVITKTKTERVDTAALKRDLGLNFLKPFLRTTQAEVVKTRKLNRGET